MKTPKKKVVKDEIKPSEAKSSRSDADRRLSRADSRHDLVVAVVQLRRQMFSTDEEKNEWLLSRMTQQ